MMQRLRGALDLARATHARSREERQAGPWEIAYLGATQCWTEANLTRGIFTRRDALTVAAGAGITGLPSARTHAAGGVAYNPGANFELSVSEVIFRRNTADRILMARIYQPKGPGPFP